MPGTVVVNFNEVLFDKAIAASENFSFSSIIIALNNTCILAPAIAPTSKNIFIISLGVGFDVWIRELIADIPPTKSTKLRVRQIVQSILS